MIYEVNSVMAEMVESAFFVKLLGNGHASFGAFKKTRSYKCSYHITTVAKRMFDKKIIQYEAHTV